MLAAKTALAIRVDAIGEGSGATIAIENRQKVEDRIRQLDSNWAGGPSANGAPTKYQKTESDGAVPATAPSFVDVAGAAKSEKKKKDKSEKSEKKKRKREEGA